ncbi:Aspartic-type endopeptidase [Pleurostoma richardsiae]|uniref:Aspartic-type endopeptidase n=1 Tax=Pleurostoma richardsiae TaxID=41990 RepID=A0AA38VW61_9PEZI|nr:Aspartic-type endopeptidase [Pleurostoma richardsiae]
MGWYDLVLSATCLGATVVFSAGMARAAGNCSVAPLVLPVKNVTFPDGIAENRGIEIILGNQVQGLRMSTTINNTRVRNALDCVSDDVETKLACEGSSGSVYSTTDGTFDRVYDLDEWNVTVVDPQPSDGTTVLQGYDTANLTDAAVTIPQFPFEVWGNYNALNKSALALGPHSSFLERLIGHSLAPSKFFGLYYGSRSELYPQDGELVIGGFNAARRNIPDSGSRAEFSMWGAAAPVNCPLQVLLADVVLTNDSGNHSLFGDPDARVSACVDTVQNAFTFTPAMFARWHNLTGWVASDGSVYGPQSYPLAREPRMGTLTVRLANGYESVIPHHELVTNERNSSAQGRYVVSNSSRVMAAVQAGEGDLGDDIPLLGGVFLSQNYLEVDHEAGRFWLSPAVTAVNIQSRITSVCNSTDSGSSGNSTVQEAPRSRNNATLGLQIGLPLAFAVVMLAVLAFWLFKRHNRPPRTEYETANRGYGPSQPETGIFRHVSLLFDRRDGRRPSERSELQGEGRKLSEADGTEIRKRDAQFRVDPAVDVSPLTSPQLAATREKVHEVHEMA